MRVPVRLNFAQQITIQASECKVSTESDQSSLKEKKMDTACNILSQTCFAAKSWRGDVTDLPSANSHRIRPASEGKECTETDQFSYKGKKMDAECNILRQIRCTGNHKKETRETCLLLTWNGQVSFGSKSGIHLSIDFNCRTLLAIKSACVP